MYITETPIKIITDRILQNIHNVRWENKKAPTSTLTETKMAPSSQDNIVQEHGPKSEREVPNEWKPQFYVNVEKTHGGHFISLLRSLYGQPLCVLNKSGSLHGTGTKCFIYS